MKPLGVRRPAEAIVFAAARPAMDSNILCITSALRILIEGRSCWHAASRQCIADARTVCKALPGFRAPASLIQKQAIHTDVCIQTLSYLIWLAGAGRSVLRAWHCKPLRPCDQRLLHSSCCQMVLVEHSCSQCMDSKGAILQKHTWDETTMTCLRNQKPRSILTAAWVWVR